MVLITIGIPAYIKDEINLKFLEECLKSIKNQTFTDFEVILIDDCSPIDIKKIDFSLLGLKKFLYMNNSENRGIGFCRQRIVELSSGEWICQLSHDDTYEPTFLEKMMKKAEENPNCIIYSNYVNIDETGKILGMFKAPSFDNQEDLKIAIWQWAEKDDFFLNFDTLFIPREILENNPIPDLRFGEDLEWGLRVAKNHDFIYLDDYLVKYRRHLGQETYGKWNQIKYNNRLIRERARKLWFE